MCVCFCIRGQNGCQDGGGKYFSHRFHNVTVKAADKAKHIWEADRGFCTKCHSGLMDVVCSGPKKHCWPAPFEGFLHFSPIPAAINTFKIDTMTAVTHAMNLNILVQSILLWIN